ncbi:mitochondrial processing peptidase [Lentinula edodes]|uniref:Alpha-MPP n=1 Tax=Lentinula edodes TaxID=5353 RepID=A0A1Q3DV96_LENED|nr:LuxS/MPP-like metallohydrolase [Lentinula edodes]KAH7881007.1 LuxS/MPP-like metallohydrolase [Lentinula edodes]KAJ3880783.1 Metalloenzyme, LuxS/M16 peptidase-like protein [Lentinula edodes]GAV98803.1 mitochondrial processing peptidase [Lentinula edodes]
MHKSVFRSGNGFVKNASRSLHSSTVPVNATQITTLPNKIRVATDPTPGYFSSIGLYVDAGSRYETPETSGASHFIDRLAFKSTNKRSAEEMAAAMHTMGGQIMAASSRETIMYQSSQFSKATSTALELISETALNPSFLPEEIEAQRDAAFYEVRELQAKPEMVLPEVLHSVAYGNRGLGNSILCPEDRIGVIDNNILWRTMSAWYQPENMVIAGAGIRHEELVEMVDKYFSSLKASPSSPCVSTSIPTNQNQRSLPNPQVPVNLLASSVNPVRKSLSRAASYLFPNTPSDSILDASVSPSSSYTGGHKFIHDSKGDFDHLYIGFEGVGIHDQDIYALATMQVLLGGGGSFSAGGPGKGMYSRLYTHILNHFSQIDHCASFHHIYTDSSLFGLFASFVPAASGLRGGNTPSQILPHLVHQLSLLMYTTVPAEELTRAKNQLSSSLMMAMESRAIQVEDLGRQVLVHDRPVPVTEMTDKIALVTAEDITRVAARLFGPRSGNKPTIVCHGHEDVGNWQSTFAKYGVSSSS